MLQTGGEPNLSKPVCSKGNNPAQAELQMTNFSLLKIILYLLKLLRLGCSNRKSARCFFNKEKS